MSKYKVVYDAIHKASQVETSARKPKTIWSACQQADIFAVREILLKRKEATANQKNAHGNTFELSGMLSMNLARSRGRLGTLLERRQEQWPLMAATLGSSQEALGDVLNRSETSSMCVFVAIGRVIEV